MLPAVRYQRRQPEQSLLHRLVTAHAAALREAVSAASDYGRGLPRHVDAELDAFLRCGLLEYGFGRVVCRDCRAEHLVAFSCKGRGLCPSCTTRRMHDTAAHLVDRVLPRARYRQWVVTFPTRIRWHLAADPKLATEALREVTRTIFAWQHARARRRGARPGRANGHGGVTFVQRFNSALELSLHFHILIPDAVFLATPADSESRARTLPLDPPVQADVESVLRTIVRRVDHLLQRRGRLDDEADPPDAHLIAAARPSGPRRPADEEPLPPLCYRLDGYSLHAGTSLHANDRQGLEALCRYGLRPPLSQSRLDQLADGTVVYTMKRRFSDGRQVLRFAPVDFLLRLCALVPPPRSHMVRYHGAFAAHARNRPALTGQQRRSSKEAGGGAGGPDGRGGKGHGENDSAAAAAGSRSGQRSDDSEPARGPDESSRVRRLDWASLLRRTWSIDALSCPRCAGRMRLLSVIEDPQTAARILDHLRRTRAPP